MEKQTIIFHVALFVTLNTKLTYVVSECSVSNAQNLMHVYQNYQPAKDISGKNIFFENRKKSLQKNSSLFNII
jgi:hypothetical protein